MKKEVSKVKRGITRSRKSVDYVGKEYGRLKILELYVEREEVGGKLVNRKWCKCECECGNKVNKRLCNILSGRTKSCGCLKVDSGKELRDRYNDSHSWIKEMYERGISVTDIAKAGGLSRQRCSEYVQRIKRGEM